MDAAIGRLLAYQIEAGHTPGALVHVERGGKVLAQGPVSQVGVMGHRKGPSSGLEPCNKGCNPCQNRLTAEAMSV